jgi:hypothetical protein
MKTRLFALAFIAFLFVCGSARAQASTANSVVLKASEYLESQYLGNAYWRTLFVDYRNVRLFLDGREEAFKQTFLIIDAKLATLSPSANAIETLDSLIERITFERERAKLYQGLSLNADAHTQFEGQINGFNYVLFVLNGLKSGVI